MADYGSLSFAEQIAFFKQKALVPTERWDDLLREAHDHAFVVAGAQKADLLADLHGAVLKGIEQGTTLEEFRRDFDSIVFRHGWTGWTGEDTPGGVAWRTRVIYETNLRSSYAAGRWEQIQAVKADRPYLEYRHNDAVLYPRPEHVAWDGLVLPADDPWWQTHYPPNGWGCKCRVFALSESDLVKLGKGGPDQAPPSPINPKTGAPEGIDRGWDYAPGASRWQELARAKAAKLPAPLGAELRKDLTRAVSGQMSPSPADVERASITARDDCRQWGIANDRERLIFIDETTAAEAFRVDGAARAAMLSDEMIKALDDPGASFRMIHNHPSSASLSDSDLRLLNHGPSAIEAIGHDGSLYRARRLADKDLYTRSFNNAHRAAGWAVQDTFQDAVSDGVISIKDAGALHWHAVNSALAAARLISYDAILSTEQAVMLARNRAIFDAAVSEAAARAEEVLI